jgi:hypothetical protein
MQAARRIGTRSKKVAGDLGAAELRGGLFIDDRPAPQRQVPVLSHLISERGGARIYIGGSEKGALATTVVDKTAPTFPPRL